MSAAYGEQVTTRSNAITIIGAGVAGAACANVLRDAGLAFRVLDRGRAVGGRMASPLLHDRRVDIGAGYFTVRDPEFEAVVQRWEAAGIARPWTDTFGVLTPDTAPATSTGPMRWATPNGLRSLVQNLLSEIDTETVNVDHLPDGDVVLAMPDPQAARLSAVADPVEYQPVVTVVCGFDSLKLPFRHAAFVNDHPVLEFVADDGARRGDGAPVLVVHTTAEMAKEHLDEPNRAVAPIVTAVHALVVCTPLDVRQAVVRPRRQLSPHRIIGSADRFRWRSMVSEWCPENRECVALRNRSGAGVGRITLMHSRVSRVRTMPRR